MVSMFEPKYNAPRTQSPRDRELFGGYIRTATAPEFTINIPEGQRLRSQSTSSRFAIYKTEKIKGNA